jgi:hypothetical protein
LPWRKFIYRALNTFIDDLFSFIVRKTPVSCKAARAVTDHGERRIQWVARRSLSGVGAVACVAWLRGRSGCQRCIECLVSATTSCFLSTCTSAIFTQRCALACACSLPLRVMRASSWRLPFSIAQQHTQGISTGALGQTECILAGL